jgi:hypothetical protein
LNISEEALRWQILNDPMLHAAYKVGRADGYRVGYEEGQDDTEEYWRRQGNI